MILNYNYSLDAKGMNMHVISSSEILAAPAHSYIEEIDQFKQVKDAHSLIVDNNVSTKDALGLKCLNYRILYAMLHDKPIVMFNPPENHGAISPWLERIIQNRLSKIIVCNISLLDKNDGSEFLKSISQTEKMNYTLTKGEQVLINAAIRSHFQAFGA